MKILKIAALFVVCVGVVVGLLYLISPHHDAEPTPDIEDTLVAQYRADFEEDWDAANDWDKSVFDSHVHELRTLGADHDVTELKDYNVIRATEYVSKGALAEWHRPNCRKAEIDRYMSGVSAITEHDPAMSCHDKIAEVSRINNVYREASSLAAESFGLSPNLRPSSTAGCTWNNFESYASNKRGQKNRIEANSDYKTHLSGITTLKSGLASVDSRLSAARKSYYGKVEAAMASELYRVADSNATRDRLNGMNKAYQRFKSEAGHGSRHLELLLNEIQRKVESKQK